MPSGEQHISFDDQAGGYDKRVGLPDKVPGSIARYVASLMTLDNSQLLEVGMGTGQIGQALASHFKRYHGFDSSQKMLDEFHKKRNDFSENTNIYLADGNKKWPISDAAVNVIFSSRAMHLLDTKHVLHEVQRVTQLGTSFVVLGKVQRNSDHPKTKMRRLMRTTLKSYGHIGKSGDKQRESLFSILEGIGGIKHANVTAATWTTHHAPIVSIESWKKKEGLAGLVIDPTLKSKILNQVLHEAEGLFKNLNTPLAGEELYEISTIELRK